jgi:hypothetical protein
MQKPSKYSVQTTVTPDLNWLKETKPAGRNQVSTQKLKGENRPTMTDYRSLHENTFNEDIQNYYVA